MDFDTLFQVIEYLSYGFSFLIFIHLIIFSRSSEYLLVWVSLMLIFPHLGNILYLIFGIEWSKRKIFSATVESNLSQKEFFTLQEQSTIITNTDLLEINKDMLKMMNFVISSGNSPVSKKGSYELFFSGELFFSKLMKIIEDAKKYIYMEFFIFCSDQLGTKIFDLLCKKSKEGVEVSLLFDGIGSFGKISYKTRRKLKAAGVRYKFFLDPKFRLNYFYINYRNHRKLVVIDDLYAFIGGFNIGDEYISKGKKNIYWRDTHTLVSGEVVLSLKEIFVTDWINSNGEPLRSFPVPTFTNSNLPQLYSQVICSGPDSNWNNIENFIHTAIYNASSSIYIESPYFILNDSIIKALSVAALSGIDVTIVIAGVPDKKILYWVAETYFPTLVEAGVKIYRYNEGFLHSKMFIVDDYLGMVGSSNFDLRSFKLSYEANVIFYNEEVVSKLIRQVKADIKSSTLVTEDFVKSQSIARRIRNNFFRISAPLF